MPESLTMILVYAVKKGQTLLAMDYGPTASCWIVLIPLYLETLLVVTS